MPIKIIRLISLLKLENHVIMDDKISQKNSYGTHVNQYRNLNKQVDPEIIIRINVYTKILCRKLENTTDYNAQESRMAGVKTAC